MKKVFAILFVMLFLSGCVEPPRAPFAPSSGALFTYVKAPLSTKFDKTKVADNFGEASSVHVAYYIFQFSIGDASLQKAMNEGDLINAAYSDYEWLNVLGVVGKLTVRTYGPASQPLQ